MGIVWKFSCLKTSQEPSDKFLLTFVRFCLVDWCFIFKFDVIFLFFAFKNAFNQLLFYPKFTKKAIVKHISFVGTSIKELNKKIGLLWNIWSEELIVRGSFFFGTETYQVSDDESQNAESHISKWILSSIRVTFLLT